MSRRSHLPLILTGVALVLAGHMAMRDPRYLLVIAAILIVTFAPTFFGRRRMRRLLMSGDVERVLGSWEGSIDRIMYPETMAPLITATAYASYGWTLAARSALSRAAKGPAWEAALEQRLFIETLLDTFEGDRDAAMEKAYVLEQMPIPTGGFIARKRVALLRRGLGALARAFAHQSEKADAKLLVRAGTVSPLVHWAMRYAAAIVLIDQGKAGGVRELLAGAPEWPKESAFRAFHEELLARAA
jgi:hypothetical protein